MTEMVFVMASAVVDCGKGVFGIQLSIRELTHEEGKVLRDLFPHTEQDVQRLLVKEALLQSVVPNPIDLGESLPVDKYPKPLKKRGKLPEVETPEERSQRYDREAQEYAAFDKPKDA